MKPSKQSTAVIKNGKISPLLGPLLSKCITAMSTIIVIFPVSKPGDPISRQTCSFMIPTLITYLLSCHTFTPIEKRAIFSKLHAFCSLRDVRNCTLSKRLRRALPNQVKLHPSNERPRLSYASFTLATVENGCCVRACVVYYSDCFSVPEQKKCYENRMKAWRK